MISDTHSTVWTVHGVVSPVLLDNHTDGKKEKITGFLEMTTANFEENAVK